MWLGVGSVRRSGPSSLLWENYEAHVCSALAWRPAPASADHAPALSPGTEDDSKSWGTHALINFRASSVSSFPWGHYLCWEEERPLTGQRPRLNPGGEWLAPGSGKGRHRRTKPEEEEWPAGMALWEAKHQVPVSTQCQLHLMACGSRVRIPRPLAGPD